MDGLRTASRYFLAILVTFVATRAWLGGRSSGKQVTVNQPYQQPAVARPAIPAEILQAVDADEQVNIRVYAAANKGVVNITTAASAVGFFGDETTSSGSGSGFVIDKQGHILTNYHVVEGAELAPGHAGRRVDPRRPVVGSDASNDVAVIRVDVPGRHLTPLPLGDSTALLVGQKVLAIGNPFGLERTLTTGIISSLDRSIHGQERPDDQGDHPDRRGDQPRELRRAAPESPRRGDRDEHRDPEPGRPVGGDRLRRADRLDQADLAPLDRAGPGDPRRPRPDPGLRTDDGLLVIGRPDGGPADRAGIRPPQVRRYRRGNLVHPAPTPRPPT